MGDPVSIGIGVAGLLAGKLMASASQPEQKDFMLPKKPPKPVTGTPGTLRAAEAAAARAKTNEQKAYGRQDTILTGPRGLGAPAPQNQRRQTLLGY